MLKFFMQDNVNTAKLSVVWDAAKVFMRGNL